MITREQIRELAEFECEKDSQCALSFYFQPQTPHSKAHREESILAKDLVRNAQREAEKEGKKNGTRADLERILDLAGSLHGNQTRAKAVFACGAHNFWREFDLPPRLSGTQLFVNRRFRLKPLAALLGDERLLWIALVDRHRARFLELRLEELIEHESLFHSKPRRGRGDGFGGYDAGHAERSVHDDVMHHFKNVCEHLKQIVEKGSLEALIVVGCQESNWHEFETYLRPYVKERLLGHFPADVGTISEDEIRRQAERILEEFRGRRRRELVQEAISQAKGHRNGVTGLRRVLRSLEMGEVQTLLLGENYSAHAVECTSCGHLDSHIVRYCPVCGRGTRKLEDVCDALIPAAIRRDVELIYVKDEPELDMAGNIAALLRFRAGQKKNGQISAAS
jgi:peptide subunit release factor 1 (eRF1)